LNATKSPSFNPQTMAPGALPSNFEYGGIDGKLQSVSYSSTADASENEISAREKITTPAINGIIFVFVENLILMSLPPTG